MKRKLLKSSSIIASIAFVAVFFGTAINNTPDTNAISAMDFKAGNIIDDAIFYNKNTMTVADIQAHLNRYMPACDTWGTGAVGSGRTINGKSVPASTTRADYAKQMRAAGKTRYHDPPYVCVQNYYENPTTHETLYETKNVIKEGMISSAQIIYDAAQKYGINPQVLLVLLKKESYVWGDNWPLKDEYNTVMGYACPDTAPCDSKYFGFYNQVEMAAWQLKYYREHIYDYNYRPYATNNILYSPTTSCGRKAVYLENIATTSLYIYTPYTPNDAALRNYPGTATCGSYGNRNFFMYFSEWFGSTHGVKATKLSIPDGDYKVSLGELAYDVSLKQNSDKSYVVTDSKTGMALSAAGAVLEGKVEFKAANDSATQKWYLYGDNKGGYYLAAASNPSYVITLNAEKQMVLSIYGGDDIVASKMTPVFAEKVQNGKYIFGVSYKDKFVLDLSGNANREGANIQMYAQNGTDAQRFDIVFDETSGYYKIIASTGKVLTAVGEKVETVNNVVTNTDTGSCMQRFGFYKNKDGSYAARSACNLSYALDISGGNTKEPTNVQIYSYNASVAQHWLLALVKAQEEVKPEQPTEPEQPAQPEQPAEPEQPAQPEQPEQPEQPAEPEQPKPVLSDGDYVIYSTLRANFVIDISGASKKDAANIQAYQKNGTVAQRFRLKYDATRDAYTFTNPNANKVMDLSGGLTTDGRNIQTYTLNNTCAQFWKIKKSAKGNYNILSYCNDKYAVDVRGAGTADPTNIHLWTVNGTNAQEWKFTKL